MKAMARDRSCWRQHREEPRFALVSWTNKSAVHFPPTYLHRAAQEQVQRNISAGVIALSRLAAASVYVRYMRRGDVFSQRRSYAKLGRKSRKYFYSLAWFLLDIAINNAYILWTNKHAQ